LKSKTFIFIGISLTLGSLITLPACAKETGAGPALSASTQGKVLQYIRDRFGVPDTVKLSLDSVRSSFASDFYEASINVDDGKNKRNQVVLVSKDGRYLIVGNILPLGSDSRDEILRRIREAFKIPAATNLAVSEYRKSPVSDFSETVLTADDGKSKREQPLLVSKGARYFIVGEMYNLGVDLRREALATISMRGSPSQGPADAPVTIVEYADLQCPSCARLHEFLEKDLLPKFPGKIRVIFKEFPLVAIHDWSFTAAIASECVYQISPPLFVPFRTLVFQNQALINATNVRDMLLSFGDQVGVDHVRLASCLDAKSTLPRIQENTLEAKRLNIQSTPTCYINGRMIVGLPSSEAYYMAVNEALRAAK
jgi:protein-disulfide isomerase